jgi:uncharacterized protein YutE (UPF0331/DUF86 family)
VVRRDLVARKVSRASAWLADIRRLIDRPAEDFLADAQGRDLTAFYLLLAIQECIDLAAHWVADAGWMPPDDAASTFDTLAARGVLSTELASRLRAAAGLRNRIAHGYASVDYARLHRAATAGVPDLEQFLALIAAAADRAESERNR